VVALDHALACASAGARHVLFDCYEFQLGDFVDIDQPRRAHEPHRHHRHEALAAGESFAPSPCVASNAQASESEAARAYSNGAAFKVRSPE